MKIKIIYLFAVFVLVAGYAIAEASCPSVAPPFCFEDTIAQAVYDNSGCVTGYNCVSAQTCSDSDNGRNYTVRGTMTDASGNRDDYCSGDHQLYEYYCAANDSAAVESYWCADGCKDGVCSRPSCSDSDGGKDYFTKGAVVSSRNTVAVFDTCSGNDLLERYCTSDNLATSDWFACPGSCVAGACRRISCTNSCIQSSISGAVAISGSDNLGSNRFTAASCPGTSYRSDSAMNVFSTLDSANWDCSPAFYYGSSYNSAVSIAPGKYSFTLKPPSGYRCKWYAVYGPHTSESFSGCTVNVSLSQSGSLLIWFFVEQPCTPGAAKSGTTCIECNSQGTAYNYQNNTKCPSGLTCQLDGSCKFCAPNSTKPGTTCFVCNSQGTSYSLDNTKCPSGQACQSDGSCKFCTPRTVKIGTQCLVCNSAGTAYNQDNTNCLSGYVCKSWGACIQECSDGTPSGYCSTITPGKKCIGNTFIDLCGSGPNNCPCNPGQECIQYPNPGYGQCRAIVPDTTPPDRNNKQPTGVLQAGTYTTTLGLTTDEPATCRYSTAAGTAYDNIRDVFPTAGRTSHSTTITGLQNGQAYRYYVRCRDLLGIANQDDYVISFSVGSSMPICSDGTPYSQCSSKKPEYCAGGAITNYCSHCGCDTGTCQSDGSCRVCTRGTIKLGTTCLVCNDQETGYYQDNSKCSYGQTCQSNGQCTSPPPNTCSDGTRYNQCSNSNKGKYCSSSGNLVNGCSSYNCACSSGLICDQSDGGCKMCTSGSVKAGTTCLVCNNVGTTYEPINERCPSGQSCQADGQCSRLPDTIPPDMSDGQPTGAVISGAASTPAVTGAATQGAFVTLRLVTNEVATCRFSGYSNAEYFQMTQFSNTGGKIHSHPIGTLPTGIQHYYIKCKDSNNNINEDTYVISFFVTDSPDPRAAIKESIKQKRVLNPNGIDMLDGNYRSWSVEELLWMEQLLNSLPSFFKDKMALNAVYVEPWDVYPGSGEFIEDRSAGGIYLVSGHFAHPSPLYHIDFLDSYVYALELRDDLYDIDFKLTMIHELTHSLVAEDLYKGTSSNLYENALYRDWVAQFWNQEGDSFSLKEEYLAPTWYAEYSPMEDMAESAWVYVMNPGFLEGASRERYDFLKTRVFNSMEYPEKTCTYPQTCNNGAGVQTCTGTSPHVNIVDGRYVRASYCGWNPGIEPACTPCSA